MWWRDDLSEVKERTKNATEKTRSSFGVLVNIFNRQNFDNSLWDDLEEVLISADVGLPTTEYILERVRKNVREKNKNVYLFFMKKHEIITLVTRINLTDRE